MKCVVLQHWATVEGEGSIFVINCVTYVLNGPNNHRQICHAVTYAPLATTTVSLRLPKDYWRNALFIHFRSVDYISEAHQTNATKLTRPLQVKGERRTLDLGEKHIDNLQSSELLM